MNKNLEKFKNHCVFCQLGSKVVKGELSVKKISSGVLALLSLMAAIFNLCYVIKCLRRLRED